MEVNIKMGAEAFADAIMTRFEMWNSDNEDRSLYREALVNIAESFGELNISDFLGWADNFFVNDTQIYYVDSRCEDADILAHALADMNESRGFGYEKDEIKEWAQAIAQKFSEAQYWARESRGNTYALLIDSGMEMLDFWGILPSDLDAAMESLIWE